jgi:prolyl oligopeptidase
MIAKNLFYLLVSMIFVSCNQPQAIKPLDKISLKPYPKSEKITKTDTYFNTVVEDPYQWLEDDQSAKTKTWITAENSVTVDYLKQIPYRQAMGERLKKLWNFEKYSAPFKEGEYTYFARNNGLQNHYVLYRKKGDDGKEESFLDPNTFSKDGTTALAGSSFSKDGSLIAYQLSEGGSDWTKVVVMKVADKTLVGDTLVNVKFSELAWKGNEGIFYSSYDQPKQGSVLSGKTDQHKLYFHKLNTPQSKDTLIFGGTALPRRYIVANVTEDGRFLTVSATNTTSGNELFIKDLKDPAGKFITVVGNMDINNEIVDVVNSRIFIRTELNAPNGKIVVTDLSGSKLSPWKDLIPETKHVMKVSTGGGKIFVNYIKDAISFVRQFDLQGKFERDIPLPGAGSVAYVGFQAKRSDKFIYYDFTSYATPGTIYKYDIFSGQSELFKKPSLQFDPSDYESKPVFYTSKDGTKIPMILTYKKGVKLDGTNATLLYGYGGFSISITPAFDTSVMLLLEQGGIYAVANLRGGGEYGTKWHLDGTKMKKQNVFDDFISAAEYLIEQRYTSSRRLAIAGESNGGLLIGAAMTQRPELFKVALPGVGVLDMLRYNKFTSGAGWSFDYGTAEYNKDMFNYLYKYSPYHALKPNISYPATLVTTADHDDRVVPAHSFKYAARLQEYNQGINPVLISIETKAGHGAGKSTEMAIKEQTNKWAFMFQNMGLSYKPIE